MTNRDKAKEEPKKLIEPLEGWKLQSDQGYMRCGREPTDRLVLLSDVVLWLMETQELPCRLVVEEISNALFENADVQVFSILENDNAKLLIIERPDPYEDDFCVCLYDYFNSYPQPKYTLNENEVLIHCLSNAMRRNWAEFSSPLSAEYNDKFLVDNLAVRFDVAHSLWGWGHVAEEVKPLLSLVPKKPIPIKGYAELVSHKKALAAAKKSIRWTVEFKKILRAEKNSRSSIPSSEGVAKAMAGELKITESRLNKLIQEAFDLGKKEEKEARRQYQGGKPIN
jgi:hypothetical protein